MPLRRSPATAILRRWPCAYCKVEYRYTASARKTPRAFVAACSPFLYTENLLPAPVNQASHPGRSNRKSRNDLRRDTALVRLPRTAVEQSSADDGRADRARAGCHISNNSAFSALNYGYRTLGDLIRATELLDEEMRNGGTAMYIRDGRRTGAYSPVQVSRPRFASIRSRREVQP